MDGIVPLWKAKGMTSFDCVFQVRRLLQTKKVGHSGTLDPEVDGVLPICVGKATKVVEFLQESQKVYVGEITLGIATETEDAYGSVVSQEAVLQPFSSEEIDAAMVAMEGKIEQIPPMYSAVKVGGKRLYEYARAGLEVERPIRHVNIYSFKRTSEPIYDAASQTQKWDFEVVCSKGTYVRTLAVDLGRALGYPSHMSRLTRQQSGSFVREDCVTIEQLRAMIEVGDLTFLRQTDLALTHYPCVTITGDLVARVKNGSVIPQQEWPDIQSLTRVYEGNQLLALYDRHPTKPHLLKPVRMF